MVPPLTMVEALAACRADRWEDAVKTWREIGEAFPKDPVANVFTERLAKWAAAGWPDPRDGVTTLESK